MLTLKSKRISSPISVWECVIRENDYGQWPVRVADVESIEPDEQVWDVVSIRLPGDEGFYRGHDGSPFFMARPHADESCKDLFLRMGPRFPGISPEYPIEEFVADAILAFSELGFERVIIE